MPDHPPEPHTPRPPSGKGELALVMGGGGARAAYQVGFLRALARFEPNLEIPIITGVSAGAINAVHLASHGGSFREAVEDLAELWESLTVDQVFNVDPRFLLSNAMRWGLQLASGGLGHPPAIQSLVDTAPLRRFLERALEEREGEIPGIREKIDSGRLKALAISTSSYTTGQSVTWIQGREIREWTRPQRQARLTSIGLDHVMASAALPLFFPAVRIGDHWYGDGGIRLTAPLSPALHLGAHRLLAISTRFARLEKECDRSLIEGYPPPAQVIGSLMNSIFLDLLDQDALRAEAMNDLLRRIPPEGRGGMRIVKLLTMRPSRDLGQLADDFELRLPRLFRFLMRGLGTKETRSPDLLSFLLFEPGYLRLMMEIGELDADARMGEVRELLHPRSRTRAPLDPEVNRAPSPGRLSKEKRGRPPPSKTFE